MKNIRELLRSIAGACWVQMIGICLALTATICLIGYATGLEKLYHWPGSASAMALPTALCFLAVGIAIFIIGEWRKS